MERAKHLLELSEEQSETLSKLVGDPHLQPGEHSFYEQFILQGVKVNRVEQRLVVCSFKVSPRFIDRTGNMSPSAIANVIGMIGHVMFDGIYGSTSVTLNVSISYYSNAKLNDELEVTARLLGEPRAVLVISFITTNKWSGEMVAEGRASSFGKLVSKI